MPKALDPAIVAILQKYDEDPRTAAWDCHGTWVVYHKAIERIAAKASITFDMPEIVEAKSADRIVAIVARGFMGDRSEWSFGEASPGNNKNAYPYAMAEKRAKDRVVLKLVGLHGLAYSEEESDDFRPSAPAPTKSSAALKREEVWPEFERELGETNAVNLTRFATEWSVKAEKDGWPKTWKDAAGEAINKRRVELRNQVANDEDDPNRPNAYLNAFRAG